MNFGQVHNCMWVYGGTGGTWYVAVGVQ